MDRFETLFISSRPDSKTYVDGSGNLSVCYHNYVLSNVYEGTCTDVGYRIFSCENCDDAYAETIAAKGHHYGDLIPEIPATTQDYGVIAHYTCANCGKYFDENLREVGVLYIGKTGAQGEKGDKGDPGTPGDKGDKGDDGKKSGNALTIILGITCGGLLIAVCVLLVILMKKRRIV